MKKLIFFLFLLVPALSFGQVTRTQYLSDIDATIYTNGTHKITAVADNALRKEEANSILFFADSGVYYLTPYGVRSALTFVSPLVRSSGTVTITNAAADGSTKGAASFSATDFDATSGNISIDYVNGQQATVSQNGFLSNTDWSTFNAKQPTISVASPLFINTNTISLTGIVPLANGGTNSSLANTGFNNLAPSQTSNSGKFLTTDGTNTSWGTVTAGWGLTGNAGLSASGSNFIGITDNVSMRFRTNNIQQMVLDSNGRLGIGIALPTARLYAVGAGATSATWTGQFHNSTGTSNSLMIRDDGNVGIGTSTPGFPLEVVADAPFSIMRNQPTVGFGVSMFYHLLDAGSNKTNYLATTSRIVDPTNGSEDGAMDIYTMQAGTLTKTFIFDEEGFMSNPVTEGIATIRSSSTVTHGVPLAFKLLNASSAKVTYGLVNATILVNTAGAHSGKLGFHVTNAGSLEEKMSIINSGNIGIGVTTPTNILSFEGTAARKIWMEHTATTNADGNSLTIQSGGSTNNGSAVDRNGGDLLLYSGIGTGTGSSNIRFYTSTPIATGTVNITPTEKFVILGNGNIYGTSIHNNSTSPTGATNQYIASGTYTPTITDSANTSARTSYEAQWTRVGNVVTVSGVADVDPTITAATIIKITLPIASNMTTNNQCRGDASSEFIAGQVAAILGTSTYNDDFALMKWTAVDVTNQAMSYIYSYQVR